MAVVGIICEYDPFHRGHAHQFDLIRQKLPDAHIVCLMSGCFTQRGMPAVHLPRFRAEAALKAGADLVLELPCAFAVRDAEHFALGGVEIFTKLGFVTHLSFGAEDDPAALIQAAHLMESPSPEYTAALKASLNRGNPFAAAQGEALDACLGQNEVWSRPNNILALCYLRALERIQSSLLPLAVQREGDYHAQTLGQNAWPSATAVRTAFWNGNSQAAEEACGYPLPSTPVCRPDALDLLLLHRLRTADAAALRRLPDCSEGLENRLKACAAQAASREQLLELLKTRRYARARLSRLCTHALLEMDAALLHEAHPSYVRLLGFRRSCANLMAGLKTSALPVISKAADGCVDDPLYQLDIRAYDLWALGAGLSSGLLFRQGIAVV